MQSTLESLQCSTVLSQSRHLLLLTCPNSCHSFCLKSTSSLQGCNLAASSSYGKYPAYTTHSSYTLHHMSYTPCLCSCIKLHLATLTSNKSVQRPCAAITLCSCCLPAYHRMPTCCTVPIPTPPAISSTYPLRCMVLCTGHGCIQSSGQQM